MWRRDLDQCLTSVEIGCVGINFQIDGMCIVYKTGCVSLLGLL